MTPSLTALLAKNEALIVQRSWSISEINDLAVCSAALVSVSKALNKDDSFGLCILAAVFAQITLVIGYLEGWNLQ